VSATFSYRAGELHAEDLPLGALAERYGTPLYVYSRSALQERYDAFDRALGVYPHRVCYAVKANGNLAVLGTLAARGAGFDIVSAGELARVLRAGGEPKGIVFSGVGKSSSELGSALDAGIGCFNVESVAELEALDALARARGRRAPVAIRVNPDVDPRTHPYVSTGLARHKFGIAVADVERAYARAAAMRGIEIAGLACHIGSQIVALDAFEAAASAISGLIRQLETQGHALEHLDLGGGLGLGYGRFTAPAVEEYAKALLAPLAGFRQRLLIEPGRAIVGPAGVLLCRVLYLKESAEKRFAIVDAGMNDLLRPALYDAWQDIVTVREHRQADAHLYDVVGPVCESADFLGLERELRLAPGDLLAVRDAGAYGFSMSSQYNGRPRPAEVMVSGADVRLVRARESVEDLMHGEALFA